MKTTEEILDKHYKHIPGNSREYCLKFCLDAMEEWGKECYNQAIDDASKIEAKPYFSGVYDVWNNIADKDSILKLKKE